MALLWLVCKEVIRVARDVGTRDRDMKDHHDRISSHRAVDVDGVLV